MKPITVLECLSFLSLLGTGLNILLSDHHFFALADHFRFQFCLIGILIFIPLLIKRNPWAFAAILATVTQATWILPWYLRLPAQECPNPLKVMVANVLSSNPEPEKFLTWFKNQEFDIVGLLEINKAWNERLSPIREIYPYHIEIPIEDNFGLSLYSRHPIKNSSVTQYHADSPISIEATITLSSDQEILVILTHPVPPIGSEMAKIRQEQLHGMIQRIQLIQDKPLLVMGDFNMTMGEPLYFQFEKQTGLTNCRRGFGWLSSWRVGTAFAIPIDHIFYRDGFRHQNMIIGPDIGSDHRPVLAFLCLETAITKSTNPLNVRVLEVHLSRNFIIHKNCVSQKQ